MYTDFAGIQHRNSEVTESMIEHDIDGYINLVHRFVAMGQPESAEMYAMCAVWASRHLSRLRKSHARKNANRNSRNQIMRDMGLVRVRGALGGVYWE
jgi:hypothetical protein